MIVLSCKCEVEDYDDAIMTSIKSWTREGNKAIDIGMYCQSCRNKLGDYLLETVADEIAWFDEVD